MFKGEVTNGAVKRLISSVNYCVHLNIMYLKKKKTVQQKGPNQLKKSSSVWIFQICVLKFRHVQKVRSHLLQKYCCNYVCDFYMSHEVYSIRKYIYTLRTKKFFFVWILMWLFRTRDDIKEKLQTVQSKGSYPVWIILYILIKCI